MGCAALVVLVAVAGLGSGCSEDGGKPARHNVTPAPSTAEAIRAITSYSRLNVATGPARSVGTCSAEHGVTTCSADFDNDCKILEVRGRGGALVIREARSGFCMHLSKEHPSSTP